MYCRKCGKKLDEKAKFCDGCGEEIVKIKQRSDAERIQEIAALEKEQKEKNMDKKESKLAKLKNPYVIPAIGTALIGFTLAAFPWPRSWQIGTSLWMKIIILLIALLSVYHSRKAKQVNTQYDAKYRFQIKPKFVTTARVLSTITVLADLFAITTM